MKVRTSFVSNSSSSSFIINAANLTEDQKYSILSLHYAAFGRTFDEHGFVLVSIDEPHHEDYRLQDHLRDLGVSDVDVVKVY